MLGAFLYKLRRQGGYHIPPHIKSRLTFGGIFYVQFTGLALYNPGPDAGPRGPFQNPFHCFWCHRGLCFTASGVIVACFIIPHFIGSLFFCYNLGMWKSLVTAGNRALATTGRRAFITTSIRALVTASVLALFPAPAAAAPLQDFLQAATPFLSREVEAADEACVFHLERPKAPGQLARWDANAQRFYLSKSALKKWRKQSPAATEEQLARCLAPLWIHENAHAQDHAFAAAHGFVWPLTMADEVHATALQVAFMQNHVAQDPAYYAGCEGLLPLLPAETAAWQKQDAAAFQTAVLERYRRLSFRQMPPPPPLPELIGQAQTQRQILYGSLSYPVRPRGLRAKEVFSDGRNWTLLRPREYGVLERLPAFPLYLQRISQRENIFPYRQPPK